MSTEDRTNFTAIKYINVVLTLVLYSLLTLGCKRLDNTNNTFNKSKISKNTVLAKIKNINASEQTDTLYPLHEYTFDYTDSHFPSTNKEHIAMIKGFETDGKGRFYIAGGNPIRLVCYNGLKKEYDILLSNATSNYGIMKLHGDTIFFVEESSKTLAKVCKNGTGRVKHIALPIENEDSIIDGWLDTNKIDLCLINKNVPQDSYEDIEKNKHWYTISLSKEETNDLTDISEENYSVLSNQITDNLNGYNCLGVYNSMLIYILYEIENVSLGGIALVDKKGNLTSKFALAKLPPTPTLCGSEEHEGDFYTLNLFHIKDFHLFLSGFDSNLGTITILDYDIKSVFNCYQ